MGQETESVATAIEPCEHETAARVITGLVTAVPIVALFVAGWLLWNEALNWSDVVVFAIFYPLTALGVTVGFHRLLTHRAFTTSPAMRGVFGVLGSAAIEGPVISWVADHRKHHACADEHGDPHSPHVGHGGGWRGAFKGFLHAHVGWLFIHTQRGSKERFAPDLLADPVISWVDRRFFLWATLGLIAPGVVGFAISGGSWVAGLTGILWGGLVRVFVLHHVTYSINSLCHMFGRRRFDTGDESRNLAWLAVPAFGEAWHNNHHAFPTSSEHGMRWWEIDLSAYLIRAMEKLGLAWNVVRIPPERQAAKLRQT